MVRCIDGNQFDTFPLEHVMASKLYGKVTGKAAGILHQDRPHAVAGDPRQHTLEARSLIDPVAAADGLVIELIDNFIPGAVSISLDPSPLPFTPSFMTRTAAC